MRIANGGTVLKTILLSTILTLSVTATQYHVTTTGNDGAAGTSSAPFKTISKAAAVMQPGDSCTVHAGTYRELLQPPRSGTASQRITFRAAPGDVVKIKGSEQITTWMSQGNGVWKVDLPNTFFGSYNPYQKLLNWDSPANSYMTAGGEKHRGDVYLNENGLYEKMSLGEVQSTQNTWYCSAPTTGTTTTIYANFGSANPNTSLAEINVRQSVIWPAVLGIGYITIDGFWVGHSAEFWSGASGGNGVPQLGAISPRWGLAWIIQNCRVKNARVIGICIGNESGSDANFATFGHHIIRNNWISHCGQAGIAGERACGGSTITGNLIEDINDRKEMGGWEGGGIKLHFVIDVLISNNCIRRVYATQPGVGGSAMWLDWSCQNTRVTGNLMYSTDSPLLNLEVFHGPVLFDNNVFIGDVSNSVANWSSNICYVNNLFYNITNNGGSAGGRTSPTFTPHTQNRNSSSEPGCGGWRVYNNLFIGGSNGLYDDAGRGTYCDYNVYLQGQTNYRDVHMVMDAASTAFAKQESNGQLTAAFSLTSAAQSFAAPQATQARLGTFAEANVMLTHPDNSPMNVDTDYYGKAIPLINGRVGPFQDIKQGANSYVLWPRNGGSTAKIPVVQPSHDSRSDLAMAKGNSVTVKTAGMLRIANMRGQVVFQYLAAGAETVRIGHLPAGIYATTFSGKNQQQITGAMQVE